MPKFVSGVLGTPAGKIGGMVIRRVNGKIFYSVRPGTYKISQTKTAKNSRQAFGLVAQLAKRISASPVLSACWKKARLKGTSAYHRVIKYNLPLTRDGLLTTGNKIAPGVHGYNLNASIDKNYSFLFDLDLSRSGLGDIINNVTVYCLIAFSNPNRRSKPADFSEASISFEEICTKNIFTFKLGFPEKERELFNRYNRFILFTALSYENQNDITVFSGSYAMEFIASRKRTRTFEVV